MLNRVGAVAVFACSLLAFGSAACTGTSSCSRAEDSLIVPLEQGLVEGNTYRSAPFGGPYTYFPPARTVTFVHGLAAVPYAIQLWLAFSPKGTLAPSAGNMTELLASPDGGPPYALNADTISVHNNTCSEFYLWVVAQRSTP